MQHTGSQTKSVMNFTRATPSSVHALQNHDLGEKEMRKLAVAAVAAVVVTGCMNLATKPSEITGSYTSDLRYQQYSCDQLGHEVSSLARRENQLVTAQEQRRKSGKVQAFWIGYGTGDGIEAAELANVRGEKEAVRRAFDMKNCAHGGATSMPAQASDTLPAHRVQHSSEPSHAPAPTSGSSSWRSWGQSTAPTATSKTLFRCPASNGTSIVTETPAAGCTVITP